MTTQNSIAIARNEKTARIIISGRFDFAQNQAFRNSVTDVCDDTSIDLIVLDFMSATYLDSSALGMMLILREKASALNKKVEIVNCNDFVKQILDVANFSKIFTIK